MFINKISQLEKKQLEDFLNNSNSILNTKLEIKIKQLISKYK